MSEARDFLEHMEHAGHSGHGEHGHGDHGGGGHAKPGPGRQIGITMALLGVMLALCAALVGSHRTELIKTTVEQSNRWGIYQSETMKYRMAEGNYDMLMALSPDPAEEALLADGLEKLSKPGAGPDAKDDPDTAEIKELIKHSMTDLADLLTPEKEEKAEFRKLKAEYLADMKDAKEDAEAYEGAIKAHEDASEWYERAQLLAEVGIVIASIALLLSSRAVWLVSVVCAIGSLGIIGKTFVTARGQLTAAEKAIEEALKREVEVEKADDEEEVPKGETQEAGKPTEKKDEPANEAKKDDEKPSPSASADKPAPAPSTSAKSSK